MAASNKTEMNTDVYQHRKHAKLSIHCHKLKRNTTDQPSPEKQPNLKSNTAIFLYKNAGAMTFVHGTRARYNS